MTDIEKIKYGITEKRTGGSKTALYVTLSLGIAADAAALAALIAAGVSGWFYVFPAILAATDAFAIFLAAKSNYRFRYSMISTAAYCIAVPVLMVPAFFLDARTSAGMTMTTLALALWIAVHAASVLSALAASFKAARLGGGTMTAVSAITVTLLAVVLALYVWSVAGGGFFGQGHERTLTFEKTESGVKVTGVLAGRGDTVVIPDELDGEKVVAFDCSVFNAEGVSRVELRCDPSAELTGTNELTLFGGGVTVVADKSVIDDFRGRFFASGDFAVANAFIPDGEGVEAYAVFDYDAESYAFCDGKVLPTWTGKDIADFDIADYASDDPEFAYAAYADASDEGDLHWCSENNGGYIMRAIGDGGDVLDAYVRFDKVYRIAFGADNDSVFDGYEGLSYAGTDVRYVTADSADALLSSLTREGFTAEWNTSSGDNVTGGLGLWLEADDDNFDNITTVAPRWTLNAPVISADRTVSAIYYEPFLLEAEAEAPADGFTLGWNWEFGGETVSGTSSYGGANALIGNGGTYTLTVTASAPDVTSLTSEAEARVTLSVTPRDVEWTWLVDGGTTDGLVYNGAERTVSAQPGGLVGGDDADYRIETSAAVRGAGHYTAEIVLEGDTALKYRVTNGELAFDIARRRVAAVWSGADYDTDIVYDGSSVALHAAAYGVGDESDTNIVFTIAGIKTDAGSYTSTARLGEAYENDYELTNASYDYTIAPRPVTLKWENASFEYDGELHGIKVANVNNAVSGEEDGLIAALSLSGYATDAGTHTMTARLPGGMWDNYSCGGLSADYVISQRALTVTVSDVSDIYDGERYEFGGKNVSYSGLVSGDNVKLTFAGAGFTATDAGKYAFTVTADAGDNYITTVKYASGDNAFLTIERAPVELVWQTNREFVYDGRAHRVEVIDIAGCVAEEERDLLRALVYTGDKTDVGEYSISVAVSGGVWDNYDCGSAELSATFTIKPRTLTVTVGDAHKTYDGEAYPFGENDYTVEGLAETDTAAGVIEATFGGSAAGATEEGSYDIVLKAELLSDNYELVIVYTHGNHSVLTIEKAEDEGGIS